MPNDIDLDTRRQAIVDLYSIRAGLSWISGLRDKQQEVDTKIADHRAQIKEYDEKITSICEGADGSKKISDLKNKIASHCRKIDALRDDRSVEDSLEEKREQLKREKRKSNLRRFFGSFGIAADTKETLIYFASLIALAGIIVVYILFIFPTYDFSSKEIIAPCAVMALFVIGPFLGFHIYGCKIFFEDGGFRFSFTGKRVAVKHVEEEIAKLERKKEEKENKIKESPNVIQAIKDQIKEEEEKREERQLQKEERIEKVNEQKEEEIRLIDACMKEKKVIQKQAREFFKELEDVFSERFHPENWKNLDRVLYYLITGRADNLRDALNLMDRRMDAEMIANEIRESSNAITREIRQAKTEVKQAMMLCTEWINDAICRAGGAIVDSVGLVANEVIEVGTKIDKANKIAESNLESMGKMIDSQQLSNALRAKSNATMEQLLRDYEYVNRNKGVHQSL